MEKEVDRIIQEHQETNRLQVSERLRLKLASIPDGLEEPTVFLNPRFTWFMAASIALLVGFNVFSITKVEHHEKQESTELSAYFTYMKGM